MRLEHGCDLRGIVGDADAGLDVGIDPNGLHLVGLGDAAFIAEDIRLHGQENARDDHAQDDKLRPDFFEDTGGLGDEHLAAGHAHQTQQHRAGEQSAQSIGVAEQHRKKQPQTQAAQQTHQPAHNGLQRLEGQRIAGALAAANAAEHAACHQQTHGHEAIDQHSHPSLRGHKCVIHITGAVYDGAAAKAPVQTHHRREPGHNVIAAQVEKATIVAGVENVAQGAHQQPRQHGHAVCAGIGHQRRRQPAREGAAQHAQREEQQEHHHCAQQPRQALAPQDALARLRQHRQQKHHHIAAQHAAHAAQHMGAVLAAAAQGEAVQAVGGAGAAEVGEQRRRQNDAGQEIEPHGDGQGVRQNALNGLAEKFRSGLRQVAPQVHGQKQQPQQGVAAQKRPAAAQIAAQQSRIIQGSCEQHRPHLLIHR